LIGELNSMKQKLNYLQNEHNEQEQKLIDEIESLRTSLKDKTKTNKEYQTHLKGKDETIENLTNANKEKDEILSNYEFKLENLKKKYKEDLEKMRNEKNTES